MAKLRLDPNPTFEWAVAIPVPGSDPVPVRCTFKHRTRKDVLKWFDASRDKGDVDIVLDIVTAWELEDEFNRENVERLCDTYAGAGSAILNAYLNELRGAREKN